MTILFRLTRTTLRKTIANLTFMMELSIAAHLLAEDVDVAVAEEEQQLVLHAVVVVAVEDVAELLL